MQGIAGQKRAAHNPSRASSSRHILPFVSFFFPTDKRLLESAALFAYRDRNRTTLNSRNTRKSSLLKHSFSIIVMGAQKRKAKKKRVSLQTYAGRTIK